MRYAEVIPDINHHNVDRVFEYSVPEGLEVQPGMRVLVPFGRGEHTKEAFVVGLREVPQYDPALIKPIVKTLEDYRVLSDEQLALSEWMRVKYNCLLVDALRLMIPAQLRGLRVKEKQRKGARLTLDAAGVEAAMNSLMSKAGTCKAPLQRAVLELLAEGEWLVSELEEELPGASAAVEAMRKKGWVQVFAQVQRREPYAGMELSSAVNEPTGEQQGVIDEVCAAIDEGRGAFLLRGVTGSGKTEVYMRCISHCIELGKSAIVLVPEISLTPQATERFRSRFGDEVAVLHSRLSSGERFDEWLRIRRGQVKVAVGARSAVFAPFEQLGLIVIDEEHESSYKSDRTPRYSAIDVARWRAQAQGAALLLGSATPSIESTYAAQQGKYTMLSLPHRIAGRPLPEVEIVDMSAEFAQGNRTIFSAPLYREMRKCYLEEKQMILFINRRGYATFVSCRGCGYVMKCESCDVSMTYHKTDERVHCHYCGAEKGIPAACPSCGQPYLKYFGAGTQQVEEQVRKFFPEIKTLRMDYDTTQRKDAHLEILSAFANREAQVLIGTQMIAKGLDFPEVTLVGVIAADATLHIPDFRSAERAFQLITQVAGRAGRDVDPGRVIVQTYTPEHPSIVCAAGHDYEKFYEYEIAVREQSEFPPFADFLRFLFTGEDDAALAEEALRLREALESAIVTHMAERGIDRAVLRAISNAPAPLHRLMGQYRHQVFIKLRRGEHTQELMDLIGAYMRATQPKCTMEINPQNML